MKIFNKILAKMCGQKIMKIEDIKILESFEKTRVNKRKMEEKRNFYKKYGFLKEDIIVNKYGYLIDGYTSYLIAKENKAKEIPVNEYSRFK